MLAKRLSTSPRIDWGYAGILLGTTILACAFFLSEDLYLYRHVHDFWGYAFCVVMLCVFILTTVRIWSTRDVSAFIAKNRWGLAVALILGVCLQVGVDSRMRVFNDEPTHQAVAKVMHEHRRVAVPQVAYSLEGDYEPASPTLSYRMYFYSFLVSVVHDLTGYRLANGVVVNAVCGCLLMVLLFALGQKILPVFGGWIAVLLLSGLPLLVSTATGFGYDTLNAAVLVLFFIALLGFVRSPSQRRFDWLLVLALLLAFSRSEGIGYLAIVALLFLYHWIFQGRFLLSFIGALSPLLLIPSLAAYRIFEAKTSAFASLYAAESSVFSFEHLSSNLGDLAVWLFDPRSDASSYLPISIIGTLGMIVLAVSLVSMALKREGPTVVESALCLFLPVFLLIFSYAFLTNFWTPTAPEAERFLLPLNIVFLIVGLWLIGKITRNRKALGTVVGLAALALIVAWPGRSNFGAVRMNTFAWHVDWGIEQSLKLSQGRNLLFVGSYPQTFYLLDLPFMSDRLLPGNEAKLLQLIREGFYDDVVFFTVEYYDPVSGQWAPPRPATELPSGLETEVISETRGGYNQRARLLRLNGITGETGEIIKPSDLPLLKEQPFDSFTDYFRAMHELHPGWRNRF